MYIKYLSILILLFIILLNYNVKSQSIPTSELNSLRWLSDQYKLGLPATLNESTACNIYGIICYPESGDAHVTMISLTPAATAPQHSNNPSLIELDFPKLERLYIGCNPDTQLGNQSSALSTITGLPKLLSIQIVCPITSIPSSFPSNLSSLNTLILSYLSITEIPFTIFQNPTVSTISFTYLPNLTQIYWPTTPNLTMISLTFPVNKTFELPATSFNSIQQLNLNVVNSEKYNVSVFATVGTLVLQGPGTVSNLTLPGVSSLVLQTKVPSSLNITQAMFPKGKDITVGPLTSNPQNVDISVTAPIQSFQLQQSNATIKNLSTTVTELKIIQPVNDNPIDFFLESLKLNHLKLDNVRQLISLPLNITNLEWFYPHEMTSLPLPSQFIKNMSSFVIQNNYNSMIDGVQNYTFIPGGKFSVRNVTGLTGTIPRAWCSTVYHLDIAGTQISSIPECFKCKWVIDSDDYYSVSLSSSVHIEPSYYCNQKLDNFSSPLVFTNNGNQSVILTGSALGYAYKPETGNTVSNGLNLIEANSKFNYSIQSSDLVNRNATISFGTLQQFNTTTTKLVSYPITWQLYYPTNAIYSRLPNSLGIKLNGYFDVGLPSIEILDKQCIVTQFSSSQLTCELPVIPSPLVFAIGVKLTNNSIVSNTIINYSSPFKQFTFSNYIIEQSNEATIFNIYGGFDNFDYIVSIKGPNNTVMPCKVFYNTTQFVKCRLPSTISEQNNYTINITEVGVPGWISIPLLIPIKFKQSYPFISSIPISQSGDGVNVTIYGQFGSNSNTNYINNPYVQIDNSNCTVIEFNLTMIVCSINSSPGVKSVSVIVDGWSFSRNDYVLFLAPNSTTPPTCQCGSHGTCLPNNQCQCTDNYQGDKCQFPPLTNEGTMTSDPTLPVASYSTSLGSTFSFNLVSIREVGVDGSSIIQELTQFNWNYSESTTNDNVNLFTYTHTNLTTNSLTTSIEVVIEQSINSRTINFAGLSSTLPPNSIKLRINITNWPYQSVLNSLVVVFSSDIGDMTDCFGNKIDPTVMSPDDLKSIKYLQIIKDNVIFYGSFFDRVLSDGRIAYSRNQLLNSTSDNNNNNKVLVGINVPYCHECIIDPNFSLLLPVDSKGSTSCPTSQSNTWKIIVGAVVGAAGLVVLSIVIFKFALKKSIRLKVFKMKVMGSSTTKS